MSAAPRLSIVTPSFQQGRFIERTLDSVWRQNEGSLAGAIEHIVMDGGSTDGTIETLDRWRGRIAYTSGPDGGQSAAINAGLLQSRGDVLAYLNSDDVLHDGAAAAVLEAFDRDPSIDVVYGDADFVDEDDRVIGSYPTEEWSLERLKLICFLCQPAVFFRRRVIEQHGLFAPNLHYCMDYEYWLRLGHRGVKFTRIRVKLASARVHPQTKTVSARRAAHTEINSMLKQSFGSVPDNWLSNYAYAVLDGRGVTRTRRFDYLVRVGLLSIYAAFRWNGFPSASLLRSIASGLVHA